jgi:predicted DNA-binding protein with PD1-like motif
MKSVVETGSFGRALSLRIGPNEDLVEAIEQACREHGIRRAGIRSGLGSLIDACLETGAGQPPLEVRGPAVEVLTLVGEVRPNADGRPEARLSGTVGDPQGAVFGGRLVRGRNPICVTAEVLLQEWLPAATQGETTNASQTK